MHEPGFEPRSPAWKAGILAVELFVLDEIRERERVYKAYYRNSQMLTSASPMAESFLGVSFSL